MNSSENLNSSSSSSLIQNPTLTVTDNDSESHVSAAKKVKLATSEGSNEDLKDTGSQEVELLFPNSSLSPEECSLSIDHIRESIFLDCDRQTLLNCRLVSRRWAYYGSKALQKTVEIRLREVFYCPSEPSIFQSGSNETLSMKNLITLMNNSIEFPASSFYLICGLKGKTNRIAQQFFDAHGALIKKIIFGGHLCIDELKQLILTQAPNLEQLHLRELNTWNGNPPQNVDRTETNEQRLERKRLEESLFDPALASTGSKPILKNLKVFKCSSRTQIPDVFIQQILECSPNLVEVVLPEDYLHFLAQPTNRLHLLRTLDLKIDSMNIESVEAVANHCHEGNWVVRELRYHGGDVFDGEYTKFERRVASIMSKILSASSTTCQKLEWNEHPKNFQIPVMPQVEQLTFQYYENEDTGYPVNILPEDVGLADIFPNLKWLKIKSSVSMNNLPIENIFGDDDPVPVPSVKTVALRFYKFRDNLRQSFCTMFPNATIQNKFILGDYVGRTEEESESDDDESRSDGDGIGGDESDDEDEINDDEFNDNDNDEGINDDESKDDAEINNDEINDAEINHEEINDDESNDDEFNADEDINNDDIYGDESNDEQINDEDEINDEGINYDDFNGDEFNDENIGDDDDERYNM